MGKSFSDAVGDRQEMLWIEMADLSGYDRYIFELFLDHRVKIHPNIVIVSGRKNNQMKSNVKSQAWMMTLMTRSQLSRRAKLNVI
jgi:hypothetical protein